MYSCVSYGQHPIKGVPEKRSISKKNIVQKLDIFIRWGVPNPVSGRQILCVTAIFKRCPMASHFQFIFGFELCFHVMPLSGGNPNKTDYINDQYWQSQTMSMNPIFLKHIPHSLMECMNISQFLSCNVMMPFYVSSTVEKSYILLFIGQLETQHSYTQYYTTILDHT